MSCYNCGERTGGILCDRFFLVEGLFLKKGKGYFAVCLKCFKKLFKSNKNADLYSGNPKPWLDRHLVLSKSKIGTGMGWEKHNRKVIKQEMGKWVN